MFLRWKKADLVTELMWVWKERVESRMTPRLRTSGDGGMEQPSMWRRKSPIFWSSALGAITMSSVFLELSLSRLGVSHSFISWRQLTMDRGGSRVVGVVLR